MTAIYRTPKVPHTKVYYFLCGYWTLDKEEADLLDDALASISLIGAPPELIDSEIKLLIANQRQPREGMIFQAINKNLLPRINDYAL